MYEQHTTTPLAKRSGACLPSYLVSIFTFEGFFFVALSFLPHKLIKTNIHVLFCFYNQKEIVFYLESVKLFV